eukprot:scaffold34595_cov20-Tisochrysis_lutea.AAC.1
MEGCPCLRHLCEQVWVSWEGIGIPFFNCLMLGVDGYRVVWRKLEGAGIANELMGLHVCKIGASPGLRDLE